MISKCIMIILKYIYIIQNLKLIYIYILQSNVLISNTSLLKSINNNRLKCGNFHFHKNITVSIMNSKFLENTSKGNGGVMYVDKKILF